MFISKSMEDSAMQCVETKTQSQTQTPNPSVFRLKQSWVMVLHSFNWKNEGPTAVLASPQWNYKAFLNGSNSSKF